MNFSEFIENIKISLNIDNEDICARLGIGAVTLENYINEYAKPSRRLMNKAINAFFADDEQWHWDILCPEIEMTCLDTSHISLRLREKGRFFTQAEDDSMSKCRIFKSDYALIAPCNMPTSGKIVLASVESGDAVLRLYTETENGFTLSGDNEESFYSGSDLGSKVYIYGHLVSIITPQ